MNKFYSIVIAVIISSAAFGQKTKLTILLDTKKMQSVDCNLNGDGDGGPAQVNKIYMHSGMCTHDPNDPDNEIAGKQYCLTQISPFASEVWQHVVGNWGDDPQDDGIGQMDSVGDGVWRIELIIEDYYSNPSLVNTDINSTGTTQSTPMSADATPYVMGIVFRNEDGTQTGRDDGCNDIFITDFDEEEPTVISSTDLAIFEAISFEKAPAGVLDYDVVSDYHIFPNPIDGNVAELNMNYTLKTKVNDLEIALYNSVGQVVYSEKQIGPGVGEHRVSMNTKELGLKKGIYFLKMRGESGNLMSEKIVVN